MLQLIALGLVGYGVFTIGRGVLGSRKRAAAQPAASPGDGSTAVPVRSP